MDLWLKHLYIAIEQVGSIESRQKNLKIEKKQLRNFKRRTYVKENNKKRSNLTVFSFI